MNDETEKFEQRLRQQPLRPIPAGWRTGILQAAQAAQSDARPVRSSRLRSNWIPSNWLQTISRELVFSLWPNSKVWAGLMALWLLIAGMKFSMRDTVTVAYAKPAAPSPALMAELKSQQRLFAELSGTELQTDADRPRNSPLKPHSGRSQFQMI